MSKKRSIFNKVSTTIDGIEDVLFEAINISYQNNNGVILEETIVAINHVIYSSITSGTILVFERNLLLIKGLYSVALSNGKYSSRLKDTSFRNIKEKITHIIYKIQHYPNNDTNDIYSKRFLKYSLTLFNTLLHDIVINKDIETYKNATHEFYSHIFKREEHLKADDPNNKYTSEIEYYINSVAIFQYSWILFLYKKNKLELKECLNFLNENKIYPRSSGKILDTLIYIEGLTRFDDFGVYDWERDIIKRPPSMVYSPLPTKEWTSLGMMIYLIRHPDNIVLKSTNRFFKMYFDEYENRLLEIKNDKDIWIPIIFDNTLQRPDKANTREEEFFERIDNISKALKEVSLQLQKIEFINKNEKLVNEPFSEIRIDEYRNAVGDQWYNSSFLHRLFDGHKNYMIDDSIIESYGFHISEVGMKMMFVENDYQFVYGSTDFGREIAKYENDDFLNSIKTENIPIRTFNNIIDCLDTLIENVESNGFIPRTIMLYHDWLFSTNDLAFNDYFIPNWNIPDENGDNSDFSLYKGIPVYTFFNKNFENYIIVSDFGNAFTLRQKRNDKWYKNQLQVDTIPIDDNEAKRIFNIDPEGWKHAHNEIELSETEAISYIKTGVTWDIQVREKFEVKNSLAYAIGQTNLKKNSSSDF